MTLRRWASAATAAAVFLGLSSFSAQAAHADAFAVSSYVALGDSYSAGLGAGSYDVASGDCKRSNAAYPVLWKNAHSPSSFDFVACSGAVTGDVVDRQLSALKANTDLVSITIGGNDAGFADTMTTCVLRGESACLSAVDQSKGYIENTLPARLDAVYDAIHGRAPSAHVVVLGYPHLYKIDGNCVVGLSKASRSAINSAADALDGVIAKRAADHGFTFGDVRPTFSGHEICTSDRWLHSVTLPVQASYHPTARGQSEGYFPVMENAA
jgi:lysophospholipase L1-like esterase